MKKYIALFRGLNMGGHNIIPMKELAAILESLGLHDVWTYVQSGNVIFSSDETDTAKLSAVISGEIMKSRGFEPKVLVLTPDDIRKAVESNPFPEAESNPKSLAVTFLFTPPVNPDLATLEALKTDTEKFKLVGSFFYIFAPDGFGRSKLAARAEKCLGVPGTSRNWRTVQKIIEMARE
jgi:uncharacterized protein (DUF1697 family)